MRLHKAFRSGTKIVPASFSTVRSLPYAQASVANAFPQLPTALLGVKGHARKTKRKRVAVLFSGGPASGGHDVLCGIADTLAGHQLFGVHGGPGGLLRGDLRPLVTKGLRGTGGFHALGTDRTKLAPKIAQVRRVVEQYRLDALIIIGGDDSNTSAAYLAHAFPDLQVIGVPKTMDCDLQAPPWLPVTFGFDTACRTYAHLVGNLLIDMRSSHKYWHVVRLMGRDASHVTLEVALQTRPTLALISEEEAWHRHTLTDVVEHIVHIVRERVRRDQDFGVILVPEGLLEHLTDMQDLVGEMDTIWFKKRKRLDRLSLPRRRLVFARSLRGKNRARFLALPLRFQELLSLNRDDHGNLKLSQLPTEELIIDLVRARIEEDVPGYAFKAEKHFYGYEGRCGAPTAFDQHLSYTLGLVAGSLVADGRTGYVAALGGDLDNGGTPYAVPLVTMLSPVVRAGKQELRIKKRSIQHEDHAFQTFVRHRRSWSDKDVISPGPYRSAYELPITVALNHKVSRR